METKPRTVRLFMQLLVTAVCLSAVLLGVAILSFITMGGFVTGILVLGCGVFALMGVHYVTWGWFLSSSLREEYEAEERENS